ncbi:MAG: 3'(2'),5'-bisphosphate nucleotidase CysQ [Raineya sp.]
MYQLNAILEHIQKASKEILSIYQQDFQIFRKPDLSPITQADRASHQILVEFLAEHTPDIPIISEEEEIVAWEERKNWEYFWLIDPLDGTKEFIDKNGEFTINLALIHQHSPILGVIHAPAFQSTYWAERNKGAFKQTEKGIEKIQGRKNIPQKNWIAAISRSHLASQDKQVLEKYKIKHTIAMGSSLKFCLLAEGKADFYYRYSPTMEWDTAAGQILVEEAGGTMLDKTGKVFSYNKTSLLNESFLCKMIV